MSTSDVMRKWTGCALLTFAICCSGAQRASAQVYDDDSQSCRGFVQTFYDWYWNRYAGQGDLSGLGAPTLADVVKRKPPVLDPNLLRLLKHQSAGGRTGSLDFDPFLNSNAPQGKYTVSKVELSGAYCRATIDAGHEIAVLKSAGASWVFVDFHYSYYYRDGSKQNIPDTDLIKLLTS